MRLVLSLLLIVLFAASAQAIELTGPGGSDLTVPVKVTARELTNTDADTMEARGDVNVEWGGRTMTAELLRYNRTTQVVEAIGAVKVHEPRNHLELKCASLKLDLTNQRIEAVDAELFMSDTGYRVKAAKMGRDGENLFRAEGAVFTACDGTWPSWRISASSIEVEIEGYIYGKQGVMYFESMPTAWLPIFVFPALIKRQSGFLPPKIGNSTVDGFIFNNRYYWVVNESVDAVIGLDYRAARGVAEQVDARYVTQGEHYGEATVRHYTDKSGDASAVDFKLDHIGNLLTSTALDVKIDYTGDKATRLDYAQDLANRNISHVDSHAALTNYSGFGSGYLRSRYTQAFSEPQEEVMQTLPSLGILGADYNLWGPLYSRTDVDASRLWREKGAWADRLKAAQGLVVDGSLGGVNFDVGGGYRWNLYKLHDAAEGDGDAPDRSAAWFEAGAGAAFEGPLLGYLHIIEPKLEFRAEEEGRGDETPFFDDSDLFGKRREVTASLETRLYDTEAGTNRFLFDLKRSVDLSGGQTNWSPWAGKLGWFPYKRVSFYADGDYDPELEGGGWLRWGAEGALADERGDKLSVAQEYVRGEARYLEVKALAQIYRGWAAGYLNRFSLLEERLLEDEFRVLYRHQCWQASAAYSRSYVADRDLFDRVVMFTISLTGLGKVGSAEW